jgi:hypothetical protein
LPETIPYAKMQFMSMTPEENELVAQGLLKYCELDTLAMVMIWEYWNQLQKYPIGFFKN